MNMLQEHFENTRKLSMLTGKSVHASGRRVNEIRETAVKAVKTPTEEQRKRLEETEARVRAWIADNEAHGFIE